MQLGFQATARSVRRRRKGESRRSTWHFGCGSHLGEEFDAAVSGVSRFGVFCRTEMLCEGLIPAISLGDVTEYNERTFTLTVNTGRGVRVFRLGERLKVRAEAADAISAKITFSLVEP